MAFNQIALYVSRRKGAEQIAWECVRHLTEIGMNIVAPAGYSDEVTLPAQVKILPENESVESSDAVLVIGGDGTILRASRYASPAGIPILGINMGHLGFLNELEPSECIKIKDIFSGNYSIDERMMLEVSVRRDGNEIYRSIALNDISIGPAQSNKTLDLEISADDHFVAQFRADGVVISTPTGSTAYSLSAGGPIMEPTIKSMCITPICAHGFYAKSFVIDPDREVKVDVNTRHRGGLVTADSQDGFPFETGDDIRIFRSCYTTKLMRIKGHSVYELIRDKLTYGNYFDN